MNRCFRRNLQLGFIRLIEVGDQSSFGYELGNNLVEQSALPSERNFRIRREWTRATRYRGFCIGIKGGMREKRGELSVRDRVDLPNICHPILSGARAALGRVYQSWVFLLVLDLSCLDILRELTHAFLFFWALID